MNNAIRAALTVQLIRHEGEKLHPYKCPAGYLTIGVGRNIEERGISREESRYLLANDLAAVERELNKSWVGWNAPAHGAVRAAVLLNMAFNLGTPRLLKFRRMRAAYDSRDYPGAAAEMLDSRWARQVGPRASELADQMRFGAWRE